MSESAERYLLDTSALLALIEEEGAERKYEALAGDVRQEALPYK